MKIEINNIKNLLLITMTIVWVVFSCDRELDEIRPASFPTNGDVFIDAFSAGLEYVAFAGSKTTAFDVDQDEVYAGEAAMRFAVPDANDPNGSYAGGAFVTSVGRDLTGYDALTFWVRASRAATIDIIGLGNDLGEAKYQTVIQNLQINSNWEKVIIPLPDPGVLTMEKGMLFYSEGPEEGKGYTFWIDEVKFENLGTIAHPKGFILEGQDQVIPAESGDNLDIGGLYGTFNLPNGIDQRVEMSSGYYDFSSSNTSIASVNDFGEVAVIDSGLAVITATFRGELATGSLTVESSGTALLPSVEAPVPTQNPDSVISMFSNTFNNAPVDTWNPFWEFSTTLVADVNLNGNDMKRYRQLNFVGILTESEKIDASNMTHFHIDIWTPDPTDGQRSFKILLVDFGADGNFGGEDDSSHELSFTAPTLQTEQWVSLDIPLSNFTGLTHRENIAQLVLSGDIPNVFVDNVYYYSAGPIEMAVPEVAAPTPDEEADNVISLFSNAYDNVNIDTWSAEWDNAELEDIQVAGDDVKLYTGLAFAGVEFTSEPVDASEMDRFHMDFWTPDPTAAPASIKIKIVDFGADGAFQGGDDVEHELTLDMNNTPSWGSESWVSIDVPLSDFAGLTTKASLAQLIISGDPNTLYVDNVYFYSEEDNSGGGGNTATEPNMAAPAPTRDEAGVISLFSDVYTDVAVDTWRTEWSTTDFEDVTIDGNSTKKYSELDVVGVETTTNTVDASEMTHFHIDVWSADFEFFAIKLVDFGEDGLFGGGDDVEHQIDFEAPAQGQWISYDIELSEFTGLTKTSDIAQYIFVGQPTRENTIFIDNVYFHK